MSARVFTPNIKLEHVISFSDAVIAFAITLMAISIEIPDLPLDLTQDQLLERLNDMSVVYLNLLFLLLISLLSLTTSFVINYASYQIPYIIYCAVVIMISSLLVAIWGYVTKGHKLVNKDMHRSFIKGSFFSLLSIPVIFGISIIISFIDLSIAQYIWLGVIPVNILIRYKYKH